jgi:hypothetical protein
MIEATQTHPGGPTTMAAMRVPLWLKVGWTIWVIVWVPFYWKQYGLQNFLFFCDLGNFFITLALWLESPLIFSWQAAGLLLFQTLYTIDLAGTLFTGSHIVGGTEYMSIPTYLYSFASSACFMWSLLRCCYGPSGAWVTTGEDGCTRR